MCAEDAAKLLLKEQAPLENGTTSTVGDNATTKDCFETQLANVLGNLLMELGELRPGVGNCLFAALHSLLSRNGSLQSMGSRLIFIPIR